MNKYRKKPVVVEAIQWDGTIDCAENILNWSNGSVHFGVLHDLQVFTSEGVMHVSENDWVIKGIKGEFYPCKPDIFEQTYEKVEE